MLVRRASVMRACSLLVIRQMWCILGLYSHVSIGHTISGFNRASSAAQGQVASSMATELCQCLVFASHLARIEDIAISPDIIELTHNLQVKSSRNTLYFSLSACSSNTTSKRLPVKLLACTTTDQTKATVKESNHLILWLIEDWTCRVAPACGEL